MAAVNPLVQAWRNHLEDLQGYFSHRFHHYRNGSLDHYLSQQEILDGALRGNAALTARWNDIVARTNALISRAPAQIPVPGNVQFTTAHRIQLRLRALPNRNPFRIQHPPRRPPLAADVRRAVRDSYTGVYRLMRSSFRYFKCLGWGGEGIASLWRYSPGPGQEHMVVIKMTTRTAPVNHPQPGLALDPASIDEEKRFLTQLGRAPHIVQRFYTAHHPRNVPPGQQRRSARRAHQVQDMANRIDGPDGYGYFLMEYCKFGNLEGHLRRASRDMPAPNPGMRTERYLPEPVLWLFFDCLVKGCMAMEEPPRLNTVGQQPPANLQGGFLPETITPGNTGRQGIVHMDLDPTNVFLYGYDPLNLPTPLVPAHANIPRLQVADFGIARNEAEFWQPARRPNSTDVDRLIDRVRRWNARPNGKIVNSLPEQFGRDWNLVPRWLDPSDTTNPLYQWVAPLMQPWAPPPPITSGPARYSSASNVWHMGMIMKVCMTLMDPDFPPYAGRMMSVEPPNPTPDQERWTYGWSLIDLAEQWHTMYSQGLLDLMAECLMAKQHHRPSLMTVQARINTHLAMPANLAVPPYWTNTFFRQPPRPRPPPNTRDVNDIDPFWDYGRGVTLR